MKITRQQSVIGVLVLLIVMSALMALSLVVRPIYENSDLLALIAGAVALCSIGLLFAYRRGIDQARYVIVLLVTLVVGLATPEPFVTQMSTSTFFLPAALALLLAEPIWVVGTSVAVLLLLLARAGWQGVYTDPFTLLIYGLTVGIMLIARLVTEAAQRIAEEHAGHIDEQHARLQQQAAALTTANEDLQAQVQQQGKLLDLVAKLETPAVQVADRVLLVPLVGHIDTRRAQTLMNHLLVRAGAQRAKLVILDIAGVTMLDSAVAGALMNMAQALRLLGCGVSISGISAEVALSLLHLGINLNEIDTVRSPQEALAKYMGALPLATPRDRDRR